jgi:8-oxo-dGTP diphosphatase
LALALALVSAGLSAHPHSAWAGGKHWRSAGGLVRDGAGRIALIRERSHGSWRWTLPKGRINHGETTGHAARREVREEAGLKTRITRKVLRFRGQRHDIDYFAMKLVKNVGVHERGVKAVRWFKPARALKKVHSKRDRRVLQRYRDRR